MCAVKPEAPWGMVDMSWLKMIGCDLQTGRKLATRKGRKGEVYAGNMAPDSVLAQIDVDHHTHSERLPREKQVHLTHVPEVGLDSMRGDGREQRGECGCRAVRVARTSSCRIAVALGGFYSPLVV